MSVNYREIYNVHCGTILQYKKVWKLFWFIPITIWLNVPYPNGFDFEWSEYKHYVTSHSLNIKEFVQQYPTIKDWLNSDEYLEMKRRQAEKQKLWDRKYDEKTRKITYY